MGGPIGGCLGLLAVFCCLRLVPILPSRSLPLLTGSDVFFLFFVFDFVPGRVSSSRFSSALPAHFFLFLGFHNGLTHTHAPFDHFPDGVRLARLRFRLLFPSAAASASASDASFFYNASRSCNRVTQFLFCHLPLIAPAGNASSEVYCH